MTTNTLFDTYSFLADTVRDDPFLLLANAVVWLDPCWTLDGTDIEDDGLGIALTVTRQAFPDIYAGAVDHIRAGLSEVALDRFICGEITQRGIPIDNLEFMAYGIPLEAAGALLQDPDFYAHHPQVVPILALFGIHPEAGTYNVEVPDCAYTAGQIIADNLVKQDDERLKQVGWALAWLFSSSGNSLIDYDDESLAEIPPLAWEGNDIAFALELIEEANGIMRDVNAGLTLLGSDEMLLMRLDDNVKQVYKAIEKGKGKQGERKISLSWT